MSERERTSFKYWDRDGKLIPQLTDDEHDQLMDRLRLQNKRARLHWKLAHK